MKQERKVGLAGSVLGVFAGVAVYQEGRQLQAYDAVRGRMVDAVTDAELRLLAEGQAAIVRLADGPVMILLQAGAITARMLDATGRPASAPLRTHAARLWQTEARVFSVVEGGSNGLVEIDVALPGDRLVVGVRAQWPVAALSAKLLDGVLVQDCLGMPFVAVVAGTGLVQGKAPGLREYRVFSGFSRDAGNVWLTGIRLKDGERVLLRLAGDASGFAIEEAAVVDDADLNAAVTPGGVGVLLQGDRLVVYKGPNRKMVDSPGISGSMRLFALESGIAGYDGGELVKLSLS